MAVVALTGAGNVTGGVASSATAVTDNKPSSTADNDLLLALVVSRNGDSGYSTHACVHPFSLVLLRRRA